ncbi:MAG: hypothetical protein EP344_18545 [Bacteroidetes bacterium]|nr:MAG: hypothetical protein EP344_18545 [Bacteroidota bacterium]
MPYTGMQKTLTFRQTNTANINQVFPLLCPVREKDWLDGWEYRMIWSESGLIEKDCVFATPAADGLETIWQVTQYSSQTYTLEFVRWAPGKNTVRINIQLDPVDAGTTTALITYRYTALSEAENTYLADQLEQDFLASMHWWEKAINYYLRNGRMLRKD